MTEENISELILPQWTDKQHYAFNTESTEIVLGGATRGGKSFYIRKAYIMWCSIIPGLQCDIFRLHFDDVIAENMQGDNSFPILLDRWIKDGLVTTTQTEVKFWNGSLITLKHCSDDNVMHKWQGIPAHVRTWGEATQIPKHRIEWLNKWVTMSNDMLEKVPDNLRGRFPKILYPTNPIGVSATYFKRNFVDYGAFNQHKHGAFIREYIPFLVTDNPHEDAERTRQRFENDDPSIRDAMLNANWNVTAGEFFPEWDEKRHVIPDHTIPDHWFRFRTFDWGTSDPFCVLWIAVSDGEPYCVNDTDYWYPRGALVVYREWYGADERDQSKGIRMRNEEIAEGILHRSEDIGKKVQTLTDSLPFQDRGGETIADVFFKNGVKLTQADTSRITGWSQMRSRLIGKQIDFNSKLRTPLIYFMESCQACRNYIPALTRHKSESKQQDAQEHGEATHACDAVRYACTAQPIVSDAPKKTPQITEFKPPIQTWGNLIDKHIFSVNNSKVIY